MKKILEFCKKNLKFIIPIIVVIIVLIVAICMLNTKPKNYKKKVELVGEAFASKSKMSDAIKKGYIDSRAAAAWLEAEQNADDLKKELKDMKKDDERVEELEEALKEYAKGESGEKIKVVDIEKPEKSSKDIWKVKATIKYKDDYKDEWIFVFYKGKIIDVQDDGGDDSLFEMMVDYYNL